MPYGTSLGVTAPTVSVTPGPDYATDVNAFLAALRAVVEAKVTPGGFNMTANLSFLSSGTYRSAVDLKTAAFEVQDAALSAVTYPAALYFAGADGDLYVNDAAGNAIQITDSGGLNQTVDGGITGAGYGTSGVAVNWDSGNVAYKMLASASTYADVVCDDVRLNDGDTNFITLAAPALASDYTVTLPAAVPASSSVMVMSSSGVVSASPSGAIATSGTAATGALTVTGAASVSSTLASGALTVTGTASASGLITATAGLTAAANQHITVSGSGRFKHGNMTMVISGFAFNSVTPASDSITYVLNEGIKSGSATNVNVFANIDLPTGAVITQVVFVGVHGAGASTRTYGFSSTTLTTEASVFDETTTDATDGAAFAATAYNGAGKTLSSACSYILRATLSESGDRIGGVVITYNYP